MKKAIIALCLLTIVYTAPLSTATIGGGCPHLSDPTPYRGEDDVAIGPKGVQTCINVSVPQGCVVNVTFQWFNYTDYIWDWIWCYFLGVGCPVSRFEDQYWNNYSNFTIGQDNQLCAWNENVSCSIFGYLFEYDWRVVANFTCGQDSYEETCYYWYSTEECTLFYIYPNMSQDNVCPCCDGMCIGINNEFGNPMNITFYRNDSQFETFYQANQLIDVDNGTYCFCIDGHINSSFYYPVRFNETYYWYVNITDTVTGISNESDIFVFHTAENRSDCLCGEELTAFIEDTDTIRDDTWIVGLIPVFMCIPFVFAMKQRKKKKQKIDETYPMHFEGEM